MSKMGAYVLDIQTKQDEEYAYVQAESLRGGRHRDESRVESDMVRRGIPASIEHISTVYHSGAATGDAEQSGCDSGTQYLGLRFGEAS